MLEVKQLEAKNEKTDSEYARAFRRLVKRRHAISRAYPYVVSTVALANAWIYHDGVLCYTIEDQTRKWLRILDLHRNPNTELVVDIHSLVQKAGLDKRCSGKYYFKPVHHDHGITSCVLSFTPLDGFKEDWLLAFKADEQKLFRPFYLRSTTDLFVRNNRDFLYVGTFSHRVHQDPPWGNYTLWGMRVFSIKDNLWLKKKIVFDRLVQHRIGVTVCFEIIGEYFYCISNRDLFEVSMDVPHDFYHCCRFQLKDMDTPKFELMNVHQRWRRKKSEGYLDPRPGFLRLERNEASGNPQIIDTGRESQHSMQRRYYRKELSFEKKDGDEDIDELRYFRMFRQDPDFDPEGIDPDLSDMPSPEDRSPHDVHIGDDHLTQLSFPPQLIHLNDYHKPSNTFLDMVNDSSSGEQARRRLRLRVGARRVKPPSESTDNASEPDDKLSLEEKIDRLYTANEIHMWPPKPDPSNPSPLLDVLYNIINPPDFQGPVEAVTDDRSIVYATGEDSDEPKPLIYISFDPAAKLLGLERWGPLLPERVGNLKPVNEGHVTIKMDKGKARAFTWPLGGTLGGGRDQEERSPAVSPSHSSQPQHAGMRRDAWVHSENPMYMDFPGGFSFDVEKPGEKRP